MIWRRGQAGPIGKVKHGHTARSLPRRSTPTYRSWVSMHQRCQGKYAPLGITVCQRWSSFENFLADMGERPSGCTLDRWPNWEGNYDPGNCRWASPTEQSRNRRSAKLDLSSATDIAVRCLQGEMQISVAQDHGVSPSMVGQIIRGKAWKDALIAAQEIVSHDR